jgi:hypothetical protein
VVVGGKDIECTDPLVSLNGVDLSGSSEKLGIAAP